MDDLISRKDAIDAVSALASSMSVCLNIDECHGMKRMQEMAVMVLRGLPSAEPEIIRCKDCELFYKNMSPFGKHECDSGNENGYCFWAVRKEE